MSEIVLFQELRLEPKILVTTILKIRFVLQIATGARNLGYHDFENHVCFSFSRVPQEFPLCEIVLFQELLLEPKILDTTILV